MSLSRHLYAIPRFDDEKRKRNKKMLEIFFPYLHAFQIIHPINSYWATCEINVENFYSKNNLLILVIPNLSDHHAWDIYKQKYATFAPSLQSYAILQSLILTMKSERGIKKILPPSSHTFQSIYLTNSYWAIVKYTWNKRLSNEDLA